jgi:hypothetical protein
MTTPKTKAELQQQRNKVRIAGSLRGVPPQLKVPCNGLEKALTLSPLQLVSSYSELLEYDPTPLPNLSQS